MRRGSSSRLLGVKLVIALFLAAFAAQPEYGFAQAPNGAPASAERAPSSPPGAEIQKAPPAPDQPESQPPPGVPSDTAAVTLELTPRPVAYLHASAEWADAFKSIQGEIAKVEEAIKKAGLTQAGHPFALFLETDDKGFQFEAMVPIAKKPEARELEGGVKIGDSPSGKAIKFLHRGPYDEIDSTYDLITAFLDEKGLDSQNRFIEEYLTDTSEPDDANLELDIYVFLK
jgi:effector-binding domain-containing protein